MKIAYIIDWNIISDSGVLNKVTAKIALWESEGHEVHLCIVSNNTKKEFIPKNISHVSVFEQPEMKWFLHPTLKRYLGRSQAFLHLFDYIKALHVDVIYFRQTRWYFPMDRIFKCAPTIMEVNSDDLSEKRLSGSKLNEIVSSFGNKRLSKMMKGVVGVTNELTALYKNENIRSITISNGIKVNNDVPGYVKQSRPQLIFVGSPGQKWHGIEKVYEMAKRLPDFTFHVVGIENTAAANYQNLIFHGYLNAEKLNKLYEIMDVGIGTLSLYVKKMSEACPLKVREYLSYGIPVILGYHDVDVADELFALNIGNYENNVVDHIDKIREFVNIFYGKRIDKALINPLIDIKLKEKRRLAFLQEFVKN